MIPISATPYPNHYFIKWDDGNINNPRNVPVSGDAVYTAIFSGVGINENTNASFQIYPNPAQTIITIQINESSNQQINIIDVSGRILLTQTLTEEKTNVDISTFAKGIYFVKIANRTVKFVKL